MLLFGHTKYFSSNLLPPLARCLGSAVWCVRITLRNEKNFFVCLCKRRKRAINWLRNNFSPRLKLFSFFRKIFSLFFSARHINVAFVVRKVNRNRYEQFQAKAIAISGYVAQPFKSAFKQSVKDDDFVEFFSKFPLGKILLFWKLI